MGAVGAAFPDVPAAAAVAYFWDEMDSMLREELLNAVYFTGYFGVIGTAPRSIDLVGTLGLYWALRLARFDRRP